jgi:CheY-like chemotaxis protein
MRYELICENKAAHALATARACQPDLILLDVVMPEMDGGDVAAQIQADPALKHIPIVFLTATCVIGPW